MYVLARSGQLAKKLPRQLLIVDLIRYLVCVFRHFWLVTLFNRLRTLDPLPEGVGKNTVMHNLRGVKDLSVPRSHRIIRPLVAIDRVRDQQKKKKVLTIGPRAEGELYNLVGYGFAKKNIRGLDLITYSPFVDLGDMHAMPYPDSSMDVIILGWVLTYSNDNEQAAREVLRVAKDGAVIAIGVSREIRSKEELQDKMGYLAGAERKIDNTEDILALFGNSVWNVYFRQDAEIEDKVSGVIAIFSVRKA